MCIHRVKSSSYKYKHASMYTYKTLQRYQNWNYTFASATSYLRPKVVPITREFYAV